MAHFDREVTSRCRHAKASSGAYGILLLRTTLPNTPRQNCFLK
ncbi:hypothetical protein O9929_12670 [Vibrio lentus]|nr:hypothetical protein [Vibrio lentus]